MSEQRVEVHFEGARAGGQPQVFNRLGVEFTGVTHHGATQCELCATAWVEWRRLGGAHVQGETQGSGDAVDQVDCVGGFDVTALTPHAQALDLAGHDGSYVKWLRWNG